MTRENVQVTNDDSDFGLKILDPDKVKFLRAGDALRVTIAGDRSYLRVVPMRAFPISMRNQYISLRDADGNELGLIRDPNQLDQASRELLEAALRRRYFMPLIHKISSLHEKFGIIEWAVETDRGTKRFFTKSLHNSLKPTDAGFIITDIENNRYEIRNDADLDPQSAAILAGKI